MSWLPRVQEHIQSNVTHFKAWPGTCIVCHSLPFSFCLVAVEVTRKAGNDNLGNVRLLERIQKVFGAGRWKGGKQKLHICFWQQPKKACVFSMCSDNHHEWTKTLFRLNSLHPHLSRLFPDPCQMACRVHLKCVSCDQWWDFVSLLTCDFICRGNWLQTAKQVREKKRRGLLWVFAISNQMLCEKFSKWAGMGRWPVLKLCHAICSLCFKAGQPSVVAAFTLHSVKNTAVCSDSDDCVVH